ncbi:hypothetical protein [Actinoplanes sp. OR16]|nr:hypothetical protein [Actinoplanes sp. OR16]
MTDIYHALVLPPNGYTGRAVEPQWRRIDVVSRPVSLGGVA